MIILWVPQLSTGSIGSAVNIYFKSGSANDRVSIKYFFPPFLVSLVHIEEIQSLYIKEVITAKQLHVHPH